MIKKWYSSIAIDLAKMVDVTDEMIRENSNGEVNRMMPDEDELEEGEELSYDNTLVDPKIFGKFGEDDPDMIGHIELPAPVVNVHYTKGKCPRLQKVLGMSFEDLDRLLYVSYFIKRGDDWSQSVPLYSHAEWRENGQKGGFLTGADAVEALLRFKGVDPSRYLLNVIPVMPLCMRYARCSDETKAEGSPGYVPIGLNFNYARVNHRASRLRKLLSLPDLPDVIAVNEKRLLQYAVDQLLYNGVIGVPVLERCGIPYESLDDLYDMVTAVVTRKKSADPEFVKSLETMCDPEEVKRLWGEYENVAYEVSFDEDGEKELSRKFFDTEEERGECDMYLENLVTYLRPLIKRLHEQFFSQYSYNEEKLPSITYELIEDALEYWEPDEETAVERLYTPILKSFDYHYRKRAMWEE